jgi:hypothetical protein
MLREMYPDHSIAKTSRTTSYLSAAEKDRSLLENVGREVHCVVWEDRKLVVVGLGEISEPQLTC